jgi:hypothetical protein
MFKMLGKIVSIVITDIGNLVIFAINMAIATKIVEDGQIKD